MTGRCGYGWGIRLLNKTKAPTVNNNVLIVQIQARFNFEGENLMLEIWNGLLALRRNYKHTSRREERDGTQRISPQQSLPFDRDNEG